LILETVQQAQARTAQSIDEILLQLGLPSATYYRWLDRQQQGQLADQVEVPRRRVPRPTPLEEAAVRGFALDYPQMGYKRLAWAMVDADVAFLRPHQVYSVLRAHDLLRIQPGSPPEALKRPAEPDHSDQVWHIDLMYLFIPPRWYYLVDILDGYSRFLVHWSLNLTMLAETVTRTVQEALEQLPQCEAGKPRLVHDHGSQFLGREWRAFVAGTGLTDIKTRVAHPQSNGRLERLHRTHREEGLSLEELTSYQQALGVMARWAEYYNYRRPHSALRYLCPADYYRGDPEARLAERQEKLAQAAAARAAYWEAKYGC
jgi:transposase InsO family protein